MAQQQSLKMRYAALQKKMTEENKPEKPTDDEVIEFGGKQKGKTFAEAWQDQKWVSWTLAHMDGETAAQSRWLKYVEMKIQELEAETGIAEEYEEDWTAADAVFPDTGPEPAAGAAKARAKGRPPRMAAPKAPKTGASGATEREQAMQARIDELTNQVGQLNLAVQQIVTALQNTTLSSS